MIDLLKNLGECGPPMAAEGVVIHNYTTTFEGSSITFTCEDGLFPNVTIMATCTGEGHWIPDPATYNMCNNITGTTTSTITGTTTDTITSTCPASCLKTFDQREGKILQSCECLTLYNALTVIIGVLFFIVGLVGGLAGGVLIVYCYVKWQSKQHPPPSQPDPLHQPVPLYETVKDKVELQLKDNVAYGQVK